MKVNNNSWHYKLHAFITVMKNYIWYRNFINRSLDNKDTFVEIYENGCDEYLWKPAFNSCQYIRRTFITPLWYVFFNLMFVVMLIMGIILFPIQIGIGLGIGGLLVAAVFIVFSAAFGIAVTIDKIKEKTRDSENLVSTIYTNYKQNVCTIIDVVDGKKEKIDD